MAAAACRGRRPVSTSGRPGQCRHLGVATPPAQALNIQPAQPALSGIPRDRPRRTNAVPFIADTEIRRTIRAETTKIEVVNHFLDWLSCGGPVIKSGDPVEQEKRLEYVSLVDNAVMLSNVVDMATVTTAMGDDGHAVTPALVGRLSPYTREHIRRFDQHTLDMSHLPPSLRSAATAVRRPREDFCSYP